jgi:hypothetical protein
MGDRCDVQVDPYGTARRQLKIQAEYMSREESGDLTFDVEGLALSDAYRSEQSGWYLQGVFRFLPRWRAGLRYDALDSGTPEIGLVDNGALPPEAFPALLPQPGPSHDAGPSSSRLRAQYG